MTVAGAYLNKGKFLALLECNEAFVSSKMRKECKGSESRIRAC